MWEEEFMITVAYFIALLLLFIIPFVVIYFNQYINRQFKQVNLPIKTPDILTIYQIFAIHWFSQIAFGRTWLVFLALLLAIAGLGMVAYYLSKDIAIYYGRFFRIWWRLAFLVTFVLYLISGLVALYQVLAG